MHKHRYIYLPRSQSFTTATVACSTGSVEKGRGGGRRRRGEGKEKGGREGGGQVELNLQLLTEYIL